MFFLFIKIKIAIISKKIFAILIIKIYNFIILTTLDNLRFNKDNLNIKFCNYNNNNKVFLKNSKFLSFFFVLFFVNFVIFRL